MKTLSGFFHNAVWLLLLSAVFSCKNEPSAQFTLLDSSDTNIDFNNQIIDSDTFNVITYQYIYNGGGVGIADVNNDSLPDIFFSGNMVGNQLYLNRGNFNFKNISSEAGIEANDHWCSGIAVVDINLDGKEDIYVCATSYPDSTKRANLLFINQGNDAAGIPHFKDEAKEYGIDDNSHTTTAAFLDYDNDGDLDLYLAINKMEDPKAANMYNRKNMQEQERVDKLFRNDWSNEKNHPVFTDVSKEAGIIYPGYSLGINVTDINMDGWADIYVSNDFLSSDIMYVNNGNGTFSNLADKYFKHTSFSAMGNDVVDINNDLLPDIVVADMMPEDNYRKKTMLGPNIYSKNEENPGFVYQYTRNTFQVNQGMNPETHQPIFSDMGMLAGISSTDWSWTPLVADFDNDGLRDLIVTNGFPKDVTDRDFIDYQSDVASYASAGFLLKEIPSVKIKNYAYKNENGVQFEDVTAEWGITLPSFSNGAAYVDLDRDGDLDYVVNNINDKAFIYKNLTAEKKKTNANWLEIKLKGTEQNPNGIGSKLFLYYDSTRTLYWENSPYRGYLSSLEDQIHFGLGAAPKIDSLVIKWPNGFLSRLTNLNSNQKITVDIKNSEKAATPPKQRSIDTPLLQFTKAKTDSVGHEEIDYVDFNVQPLMLHKLSQYGPGLAAGDVNSDDLDDIYVSGSHFHKGIFLIQQKDGSYKTEDLLPGHDGEMKRQEELASLFFDADNDGDLDLYLVSGGYEYDVSDTSYQDRFFENIDNHFYLNSTALPKFLSSGSCVKAADFDQDGDLDLFVSGRVFPYKYPTPVSSYILKNNSTTGHINFKIVNNEVAPVLDNVGMITDALWTDFNNDNVVDLVMAGEFTPLMFLENQNGILTEVKTGIEKNAGMWNSLAAGDFDNDGDMDYIAGNNGLNTPFKISPENPLTVYGGDFDSNKRFDAITTVFFKNQKGQMEEFPYLGRVDFQKQIPSIKERFPKHADFGAANIHSILDQTQLHEALKVSANYMQTSFVENLGNNKFRIVPLPIEAQVAPVFGIIVFDFNNDGNLDALLSGNDFGTELTMGRSDAFNGLMLLGDGKGHFESTAIQNSGMFIPGNGKSLAYVLDNTGSYTIFAAQNQGELKTYTTQLNPENVLRLSRQDFIINIELENGWKIKKEAYYGEGYLSQSSRAIVLPPNTKHVEIIDFQGNRRTIGVLAVK